MLLQILMLAIVSLTLRFRTYFASGGGFSNYFKAPEYQKNTVATYVTSLDGLHHGLYDPSGRAYPDVAAQG